MAPGDTDITAPGLPFHTVFSRGREPTSIAFFSTAGTDRLYSGVTNKIPSQLLTCSRNAFHAAGSDASRSSLYKGSSPIFIISSESEEGAIPIRAFAIFKL